MSRPSPRRPLKAPTFGALVVYSTMLVVGVVLLALAGSIRRGTGLFLVLLSLVMLALRTWQANRGRWPGPGA